MFQIISLICTPLIEIISGLTTAVMISEFAVPMPWTNFKNIMVGRYCIYVLEN